mgnify:CR=1 FL=1
MSTATGSSAPAAPATPAALPVAAPIAPAPLTGPTTLRALNITAQFAPDAVCTCSCPSHCRPPTWLDTIKRFFRNWLRAALVIWDLARPFMFKQVIAGMAYGVGFQLARILAKMLFPTAFPSVVYMPLNAQVRFVDGEGAKPVPVPADYYFRMQQKALDGQYSMDSARQAYDAAIVNGNSSNTNANSAQDR